MPLQGGSVETAGRASFGSRQGGFYFGVPALNDPLAR
jgi:hypothetical protein